MAVEFCLLGNIEARLDGESINVGYAQLRSILALLLIDVNRIVAVDRLVDRVWGSRRLPRRPRAAVQHGVTQLRNALAPVPGVAIMWQDNGYRITAEPETVDLHRFQQLIARAHTTRDDRRVAALFDEALRLWRGEPFAGLDTPWLTACRATLAHQRHAAQLDLTDVLLRQGKHAELLPGLFDRAGAEPLDERLAGQLMLALYRAGQAARALDHYERIRRRLADELGTDPSPPLRRLHHRILAADPGLSACTTASPVSRVPLPRHLPAAPRLFTGRCDDLAHLTASLTETGNAVPLAVISGAGGIGKTWLALHWAHQHLDRFPDGQLYVNLRGFDPSGEPMPTVTALRGFLDALGIAIEELPREWDAQIGLYRSVVADKRMVIVLDNARDTDQIAPLLPGSPACTVLVTSRNRLDGLVTGHGARSLTLDVLTENESRQLLARHFHWNRIAADPDAMAELLGYCAGLPLAVSVVAAHASHHPQFPLAVLAAQLRDQSGRLAALDTADASASLRAVLSWSYHALSAEAATAYGLVSLACGPDISLPAAASLLALPTTSTLTILRELEHASLVQQHDPGRFRMHDLIRLYAAQRAERDLPEPVRSRALRRLVDFYLHTAFTGDRLLQPLLPPIQLPEPRDGYQPHHLEDQQTALAWFTTEHLNLLAAQRLTSAQGWAAASWQLAWLLTTFLYRQGRFHAALATWQAGQEAANELDDPSLHAGTHQLLGAIFAELGRYPEALHHLTLAEQRDDLPAQAYTHHTLGWSWSLRGDDRRALEHAARALGLYRTLGMPAGETRELTVTGWYRARLGDFAEARTQTETALALARHHQLREDEGLAIAILGFIAQHTGRHRDAVTCFHEARSVLHEAGNTYYEGTVLDAQGETYLALGESESARGAWEQALELFHVQGRANDADRVRQHLSGLGEADS
ncbi:AfsR/SARP family transcriptional regulator [Amycolatopsis sp. CA-230715]|uniref:AfsR/SARP family transcriptional regulator n=1 Tax=Amycolatopsis sp. CA-230715 TaxID=2745196 RepID=UPI001C02722D|nr:BTAD domain-containing putative transcriptional regulator [Amycolatopsis sp. CA-230715]QWF78973.1 Regulatory protein AfsR [Amycolatopsis sp. CA-230715]